MITACPACGANFSLDALVSHDGARTLVAEIASISGPLGGAVLRYLALFRPAKRSLSWDRAARLLNELAPLIREARVERRGRVYPAPREAWVAAIEHMLDHRDRLTLPLKSHGYLIEVLIGAIEQAEARAEARQEDRRAGRTPIGGVAAKAEKKPEAPAQKPARARPETIARALAEAKKLTKGQP